MIDTRKNTTRYEMESEASPLTEDEMLKAIKSCELWDALRKFANKDVSLIAHIIYDDGPRRHWENSEIRAN